MGWCMGVLLNGARLSILALSVAEMLCGMSMNNQSMRQGKAEQLHLKIILFFSRENEELPQAGLEPATFCVLGRCSTN